MPFVILAVIIGAILGFLSTPIGKGWLGELIVKINIGKTKENEKYVINDLRLRIDDKTAQIDHVVIKSNGIFVIETKNYSGRIYGNESQLEWTQVLNYGKVKNKLYNPLRQNQTHIYRLTQILGNRYPFISAIVFVKGNIEYIKVPNVYTIRGLKKLLKFNAQKVISKEEMYNIYNMLLAENEASNLSTKEHITNINKMKENINNNICPRCGGMLVKRTYANREFYGCSNFPKCNFTKK